MTSFPTKETAGTRHHLSAFGIAATFIGTTIGAGYASGQEILQYFVSFGTVRGGTALVGAGLLFFVLAYAVLWLAHRLRTDEVHDLVNPFANRWPTRFADLCIVASLLGTLIIMLAGAGAALERQVGLPPLVGAALMGAVCVLSVAAGARGLVSVQKVVVPAIIVVAVGVAVWALLNPVPSTGESARELVNSSPLINAWWMSGILYVAFNIQLVFAVFAPLGKDSQGGRPLLLGALVGALGIVLMAGALFLALTANAPVIGRTELPMVELAGRIAPWAMVVYTFVLLLAQFTTAASCLFGLVERSAKVPFLSRLPAWGLAAAVAGVSVVLSGIGFSSLVGTVYPALGYAGLVIIVLMVGTLVRGWRNPEDPALHD